MELLWKLGILMLKGGKIFCYGEALRYVAKRRVSSEGIFLNIALNSLQI